jgi:agmatinase
MNSDIVQVNRYSKEAAQRIINGDLTESEKTDQLTTVNGNSEHINEVVRRQTASVYESGKLPVVLGGDHSVPLGAFQATADHFGDFGILHFDAHADLRDSYLGFTYSHASIMFNALKIPELTKIVQVGIRDFGKAEMEIIKTDSRLMTFFDRDIQEALLQGASFSDIVEKVVESLPKRIWISFDIDGLDPSLCPNTGTPVVGGLSFSQADAIIKAVSRAGIKIVGLDLNEVAPDPEGKNEWDANVGMRLLYRMIGHALNTH